MYRRGRTAELFESKPIIKLLDIDWLRGVRLFHDVKNEQNDGTLFAYKLDCPGNSKKGQKGERK